MTRLANLSVEQRQELTRALESLPAVVFLDLDVENRRIWVIQDPQVDPAVMEEDIRACCNEHGHEVGDFTVRCALPIGAHRRRVRLADVIREPQAAGRIQVTVTLEWRGETHVGEETGDKGAALELKTTAAATLRAVAKVISEELDVRLIGVKPVHAFDADLMVVSLLRGGDSPQRLVGTVVVHDSPVRAVALAVLNALNRLLGNFLYTTD